jgi:nitroimidazol reductase NimA-like FMN-containing flavoprotein (pyridoxamine 5'-phosphate oxidase superfamily)
MEEPKTRLIEMRSKSLRGPLKFSGAEVRFLERNEIARLATISSGGMPHVVPVSYVFKDEDFLIAVDYGTKKYRNLLRNRTVGLVVDTLRPNRGVMVQGKAEVFEKGPEFRKAYAIFHKRFGWVRADPWKEGEAPFVRIKPVMKASWAF